VIGRIERGTALPETALVIGIALMLILGAVQATVMGYSQVSADGAAFVAAHTAAIDPSANSSSAASTAYPDFSADALAVSSPAPNLRQATIAKAVDGFFMVPGLASSYQLSGADVEFAPLAAANTPQTFSFSVDALLNNYCPDSGTCTPRQIYLAQNVDTQANGNGWNGPFAEWRCHQQYYASLNWPQQRPLGGLQRTAYDPEWNKSAEYPIYSWDTGSHACK
jgi:hypothetical protein